MKIQKKIQAITIAAGSLLLILRLFFPVKDYFVYENSGVRVSISSFDRDQINMLEKSIDVPQTLFHSLSILILISACLILVHLYFSEKSEP